VLVVYIYVHDHSLVFVVVSRFVRQCLSLLSAMVSQGAEAAREVISHIHIKALSGLAKRKDKRVWCSICLSVYTLYHHVAVISHFHFSFYCILFGRENLMFDRLLSNLCCPFWCLEMVQLLGRY